MSTGNLIAKRVDRLSRRRKRPRLSKLTATALESQVGASVAGLARSPRHTTLSLPGPHSSRRMHWTTRNTSTMMLSLRLRHPQCGAYQLAAAGGSAIGVRYLMA